MEYITESECYIKMFCGYCHMSILLMQKLEMHVKKDTQAKLKPDVYIV